MDWHGVQFDIPYIRYTPFEIFSGQVPMLDINFIKPMEKILVDHEEDFIDGGELIFKAIFDQSEKRKIKIEKYSFSEYWDTEEERKAFDEKNEFKYLYDYDNYDQAYGIIAEKSNGEADDLYDFIFIKSKKTDLKWWNKEDSDGNDEDTKKDYEDQLNKFLDFFINEIEGNITIAPAQYSGDRLGLNSRSCMGEKNR